MCFYNIMCWSSGNGARARRWGGAAVCPRNQDDVISEGVIVTTWKT